MQRCRLWPGAKRLRRANSEALKQIAVAGFPTTVIGISLAGIYAGVRWGNVILFCTTVFRVFIPAKLAFEERPQNLSLFFLPRLLLNLIKCLREVAEQIAFIFQAERDSH